MILFAIAVTVAAAAYQLAWLKEPHLHNWRQRHNERGEASWQLVLIAVCLLGAITVLTLHGDEVPAVLSQGLGGALLGIGTSEATLRRHEKATAKAVHPRRHTRKTPHPSKES